MLLPFSGSPSRPFIGFPPRIASATDAELYSGLWEQYQDLAAGMRAIREAVEQAFGATLPPTATLNDELEIITRTIQAIANRSVEDSRH